LGLAQSDPIKQRLLSIYIIKEFVQPKMSLNRELLIWKQSGRGEREGWEGVRNREKGGQVSRSAGRHIYGLFRFWRDRRERQRYREIQRDRET
jgi:hypothetical protein